MRFEDALRLAGLIPRDIVPDGKIRRCSTADKPSKRNGWYSLHPDGHGSWGDWGTGSGEALGHWRDELAQNIGQSAEVAERMRQQRAQERATRIRAIAGARRAWEAARPMRKLHPYLERKGLSAMGCAGLREAGGLLVVPVMWGDSLVSIQTISADGEKKFYPGAPVKGGAHVMSRQHSALSAFCEGLATGLAVYQAVKQATVVVAFDAGNLLPVIQRMKPTGSVVLCADNDHGTQARRGFNPGREKAANAAELIGAGVAWPEGIEGTDWCDALAEYGQGAHKRIERRILSGARYVVNTS